MSEFSMFYIAFTRTHKCNIEGHACYAIFAREPVQNVIQIFKTKGSKGPPTESLGSLRYFFDQKQ